ncbi:flavin reductase family protein [Microbacterium indicum]|uniref:flavin reductase family protein n=1 Tax=Microbacterium indicum TaxID=358100 RepID=UPI0003F92CED|nr:flavin reductase family protein [Microbacterium indicum]
MNRDSRTPESDPDLSGGFRAAFRDHPAGVSLITAAGQDGPVGLTASSVASVAVDPPTLSFSVTRSTGSAGEVLRADTFVVHLLADSHASLATAFATSGAPRFTAEQNWTTLPTGEPLLRDARVALRCRMTTSFAVGSSTLVLAEVLDVYPGPDAAALTYHDRRYRRSHRDDPSL